MGCLAFGIFLCQLTAFFLFGTPFPHQTQPSNPVASVDMTNSTLFPANNTVNTALSYSAKFGQFTLGEGCTHPIVYHIAVKENIPTRGSRKAITVTGHFEATHQISLIKGNKKLDCKILSSKKASCPIPSGAGVSQFHIHIEMPFKNETIKSQTQSFKYASPVIHRIIQRQASPTSGNLLVTIVGKNFGANINKKSVRVSVGNFGTVFGSPKCFNKDCSKEAILFFTPTGFGTKGNFVSVSINGLTSKASDDSISYASPVIHQMYPLPSVNYHGKLTLIGENFGISTPNLAIEVSIGTTKCNNAIKFFDNGNETIVCFIDYEKTEDLNTVSVQISTDNEVQIAIGTNYLYMFEIPKVIINSLITTIGLGNQTSITYNDTNSFSEFLVTLNIQGYHSMLVSLNESEPFLILSMIAIWIIFHLLEKISFFLMHKEMAFPLDISMIAVFFGLGFSCKPETMMTQGGSEE